MNDQQPGRKRSWGKILGLGCLVLALLGIAGGAGLLTLVMGSVKRSEAYREAVGRARTSPTVVAALGEPIDTGWLVSGSVSVSGPSGEASLSIPLRGSSGTGTLFAEAERAAGAWTYSVLAVAVEATDERIDLLADSSPPVAETSAPATAAEATTEPREPASMPLASLPEIEISSDVPMMIWAQQNYDSWENPLHSEVTINGELINIYTSSTFEPIGEYLRGGWNTITVNTTPQEPAANSNGLIFRIGPMYEDEQSGQMVMRPVLWRFRNDTDWRLENGQFRHPLGPDVKRVSQTYEFFYAGLLHESRELSEGDYVLESKAKYDSWNTPIMATVIVNGTPVNSFLLEPRQIVVTSLLKQGKNEIRLISTRVSNVISDNDVKITIAGPAQWNIEREQYLMRPIVEFEAGTGWSRDPTTQTLVHPTDPAANAAERVIPFFLRESPGPTG